MFPGCVDLGSGWKLHVWSCYSFAYQLSDVTLVRCGESEPRSPLLGRGSGCLYDGKHAYFLVYCFKTANAFLLFSGTVRSGDRSAPNAPVILFLCTIYSDNKSFRQEVCVYTAPAAILAGLIL